MSLNTVHIAIDPGLDTVKVAYTYARDGVLHYGNLLGNAPYPAWGYYNEDTRDWRFGPAAVRFDKNKSYRRLVKIKSLFMMPEHEENIPHYVKGNHFPNFYFPAKVIDENFDAAIANKHTFEATQTPRDVCRSFFITLFADRILPAVKALPDYDPEVTQIVPSVIYPAAANKKCIEELKRLVFEAAQAFTATHKILLARTHNDLGGVLSTKATAICAYKSGALSVGDVAMIFNIGETDISVTKVALDNADNRYINLAVDGADGHLSPANIGGADVDHMIKRLLDNKLRGRVPLGRNAESAADEEGTYKQQYSLLRSIKKTKEYFSDDIYPKHFPSGVPFSVMRDLVYDIPLTREELITGLTEGEDSVAARLTDYIIREIQNDDKHPERTHINKVILVGGTTETYGLKSYIIEHSRAATRAGIQWVDLDDATDAACTLSAREKEIYSAAAGGALHSAGFVILKTLLRKYYGTWMIPPGDRTATKCFAAFRYKNGGAQPNGMRPGEAILAGGARYHTEAFALGAGATIRDELFSADTLPAQGLVQIGNIGSPLRDAAATQYGIKTMSRGTLTNLSKRQIVCIEGVEIDEDGRAKPFVETADPRDAALIKFEFDGDLTFIG